MTETAVKPSAPFCVVIPAYNESATIEKVVQGVMEYAPLVVVVDDGSSDNTGDLVEALGAVVIRHRSNMGKGASLVSGFHYAKEHHIPFLLTMDADGQHDPAEIPRFIDVHRRTGIPVLVGNRMWDASSMPPLRRWTNRIMSRFLTRVMGTYLPDTQCGFRLYQTDILPYVHTESPRFAMESEILLYLTLRGFRVDTVRISTIYQGEKSRIHPVTDTMRFFSMLLRFQHMRKVIAQR